MKTYLDIANETYHQIFIDDTHILKSSDERISQIISVNASYLKTMLEKELFKEELLGLIAKHKLEVAERQKKDYGEVLMVGYKEILTIYERLYALDFSPRTNEKVYSFFWKGSASQLHKLHQLLIDNNIIDRNTSLKYFENLMSQNISKPNEPILWLESNGSLVWFFEKLIDGKLIIPSQYQSIIGNLGLFKNKNGTILNQRNLSSTKSQSGDSKAKENKDKLIENIIQQVKNITLGGAASPKAS